MMYERLEMRYGILVDSKRDANDRLTSERATKALYSKLMKNANRVNGLMMSTNMRIVQGGPPMPVKYTNGVTRMRTPYFVAVNIFRDVRPEHAEQIGPHLDDGPVGKKVFALDKIIVPSQNGHSVLP